MCTSLTGLSLCELQQQFALPQRTCRAGGRRARAQAHRTTRPPSGPGIHLPPWSSDGGAGCGDSVPGSGVCASREVPECGACGAVLRCERPGGTHAGSV